MTNVTKMKRSNIKIEADGPLKVKVNNKIVIEICQGDIINDKSDIKCASINWNLDPNHGIGHSFVRFGGNEVYNSIKDSIRGSLNEITKEGHYNTGGLCITNAFKIPHAKKLFFIMGPKFDVKNCFKDDEYLRMATLNTLQASIYVKPTCHSICLPGISIGEIFQFPIRRCARIMIEMCINWSTLVHTNGIRHIKLMNWRAAEADMFAQEMEAVQKDLDKLPRFLKLTTDYGATNMSAYQRKYFS